MTIKAIFRAVTVVTVGLLAALSYFTFQIRRTQNRIAESEIQQLRFHEVADDLQDSSDQLTMMARFYADTGEPQYERYFFDILAIRNGERPIPPNYSRAYWNLILDGTHTHPMSPTPGEKSSFESRLQSLNLTDHERALLRIARERSDALTSIERRAFAAVKGLFPDKDGNYTVEGKPDLEYARGLLSGPEYLKAKGAIMKPIAEFSDEVEKRLRQELAGLRAEQQLNLRWGIVTTILLAMFAVTLYGVSQHRIIRPIACLSDQAGKLMAGDYTARNRIGSPDEVGTLAAALNRMSDSIHADLVAQKRKHQLLAQALESTSDCIVLTDLQNRVLYVNDAFLRTYGYEEGEVIGKNADTFQHDLDSAIMEQIHAAPLEEGWSGELWNTTRSGRRFPISLSTSLITKEGGVPIAAIGVIRDITKQKEAEEALRKSEAQSRLLARALQSANDCVVIADVADRILYVNAAFLRTYEYEEEELIGKHIGILRPHDIDSRTTKNILPATLADGWRGEMENISRSGRRFPISLTASTVKDESGKTIAAIGVARDITREKQAEHALRVSEEKYAKAFAASPDCIAISGLGSEGVLEVNDCFEKLTGYSRQEILGKTLVDLGILAEPNQREQFLEQLRTTGSARDFEYKLRRKDGTEAYVLCSGEIVEIGGFPRVLTIHRDITQKKKAEGELRRLNRALRTIVECRQKMAQAKEETELLQSVCSVLVDSGGYRMVWVGYAEYDECKSVRPVVSAGVEDGYLSGLNITWADTERAWGPTGTAIRTGKPSVGWDLAQDPRIAPWRAEAQRRGYASSISLPLLQAGVAFGALTLYSPIVGAFDEEEMRLLTELTNDLAYGIHAIRVEAEQRNVQAALHESEERFRTLIEEAPVAVGVSFDGITRYVNSRYVQMYGFDSAEELVGHSVGEQWAPAIRATIEERARRRSRGETVPDSYDGVGVRKDGSELYVHVDVTHVRLPGGAATLAFLTDITERKHAEDAIRKAEAEYRNIFDGALEGISRSTPEGKCIAANPAFARLLGYGSPEEVITSINDLARQVFRRPEEREHFKELLELHDTLRGYECEWVRKDGTPIWVSLTSRVVRDPDGSSLYYEGLIEDVTERRRAQQQLIESEGRFRAVSENSVAGIYVVGIQDRRIAYVNPAMAGIVGYEPEEVIGRDPLFVIHPDDHALVAEYLRRRMAGETGVVQYECRGVRKDGEVIDLQISASVMQFEGRPALIGNIFDITERKRAEQALRENEEKFRKAFFTVPDAFCLSTLEDGTIIELNDSYPAMFAYKREELLGRSSIDLGIITREERQKLKDAARSAGTVRDMEVNLRKKTGEPLTALVSVSRIDIGGKQLTLEVTKDITDRKRAEEALVRLRHAVDASGEVVFMTDREGLITFINPEFTRLYGYGADEVIGKVTPRILNSGETASAEYDRFWQGILTKQRVQDEIVNRAKDGRKVTVERSVNAVLDNRGEIAGYISIQRDITARKQLEQQFQQAQKMEAVGRLAGGVAHDFNNLLGIIKGYTDLVLQDQTLVDRSKQRLTEIKKATDRAVEVTRQLLAFSRKQVVQTRTMDLNAVVRDTSKMLGRLLGEDVEFVTSLASDLGSIEADPTGIDQIIMNLAVNARDAMPKGGKLTIETANISTDTAYGAVHADMPPGDYVMLAVSDNGTGIDPEIRKNIFEPFFTTKETGRGTGLGLSTVYGIVQQSHGHIWLYSEVGHGTTFKIYFPRVGVAAERQAAVKEEQAPRGSATVLLVEDDPGLRKLNSELLQDLGYTVLSAANGPEAIDLAARHTGPLELLVTDVVMPGINGSELAERLVSVRPDLKVLFVSGYTDSAVGKQISESGAAFLQKPFDRHALGKKLRDLLDATVKV